MKKIFCKIINEECVITHSDIDCSTFDKKATIKGLKDCSIKTCEYKGHEGCLLKNKE